jgi:CxxC motif-containing protein (DUF1111 family)
MFEREREQNSSCQMTSAPNDVTGKTGISSAALTLSDVEKFALYMRLLAPPTPSAAVPGGAASIARGAQQFNNVGCGLCHTPAMKSGNARVAALANQPVALYSDLALHNMGPRLADNITAGACKSSPLALHFTQADSLAGPPYSFRSTACAPRTAAMALPVRAAPAAPPAR